ncbi:MAG TPA: ABC transporter ATP-binding protein [Actinomycetales bacterium]|nr:ABC transporter ATP-binding protein [Actinomycetales bacterium]
MIELDEVSHRFGERVVLRDVTLDLSERRIGVIGANGSGKSTFARLLNGLVVPTRGRVLVEGHDTRREGAEVRRRVGFVFTDPDAQIVMPTVAEDVGFSLRRLRLSSSERDRRVREVLDRFGLADHADQPAHLLSGGQKQLLALAAVLVTEPTVLVCDEPTTLLDLRNSERVASLLRELPQQVVLVTHHLDLLEGFDRVLVVDDGEVVHDATPESAVQFYRDLSRGLSGGRLGDGGSP